MRGNEDVTEVERFGEPGGVHRSAAAEGDEGEVARIASALDRHRPDRALHRRVGDAVDAFRRSEQRQPERLGHVLPERALGARRVEPQLATDEIAGVEIAEDEIRVSHRRPFAAAAVAGWTGHRPGALRADAQHAAGVDPRERAAAGTDLGDIDGRDANQMPAALDEPAALAQSAAHLVLRRERERAALDDRRLRGGAAHVEGDQVLEPRGAARRGGGDHSRRPGRSR